MQPTVEAQWPLKWSHMPITFHAGDHPDRTSGVGVLPLVVSPTINNIKVTKMLVDGGASLNLISTAIFERMHIPEGKLRATGSFQGINPGATKPKGQISLPVTFGTSANFRTEMIVFDVADIPLSYNMILGRPALAKFMAASHYAYNTLKMLEPDGVITVKVDKKDAIFCIEKMYKTAAAAASDDSNVSSAKKTPGKSIDPSDPSTSGRMVHNHPRRSRRSRQGPSPSRFPSREMGPTPSPMALAYLTNRKARSLLSSRGTLMCSHGNHLTSPGSLGK